MRLPSPLDLTIRCDTLFYLDEATARIENLLLLMPDWLQKIAWARPHLGFKGSAADRPLKDVIDEAKAKAANKGFT